MIWCMNSEPDEYSDTIHPLEASVEWFGEVEVGVESNVMPSRITLLANLPPPQGRTRGGYEAEAKTVWGQRPQLF